MMRLASFLLTVLAVACLSGPAQAQFMNYTPLEARNICWQPKVYAAHDAGAPAAVLPMPARLAALADARSTIRAAAVASLLATAGPRAAVRACTDEVGETLHLYLRLPALPRGGICLAHETEVFRGTIQDVADVASAAGPPMLLRGWLTSPPDAWTAIGYRAVSSDVAMVSGGACPPVSDPRYIVATDVPDAALKGFDRFWRNATASPEAFEAALRDVPFQDGALMPWKEAGATKLLANFRDQVFQGKAAPRTLGCEADTCTLSVGFMDRWIEFRITPNGLTPVRQGGYLMA
jgi:hypothetical protein